MKKLPGGSKFPANIEEITDFLQGNFRRAYRHSKPVIQLGIQPVAHDFFNGTEVAHHALFVQLATQRNISQPGFTEQAALGVEKAEIHIGEIIDKQQHESATPK